MTDRKRRKGLIASAALLGGVLTVAACGASSASGHGEGGQGGRPDGAQHENSQQVDEAAAQDASQAKITITPPDGSTDTGLNDAKVTASGGKLTDVTMTKVVAHQDEKNHPQTVKGTLSADGSSWKPGQALSRATTYKVTAHAVDAQGRVAVENSTFTTVAPTNSFIGNFTPEDGSTVGVGMPVSINFDKPVKNRQAVQSAITVASSSNQQVVGHWFGNKRLDFRPKDYWKPNSQVTMKLALGGVEASPGVQGIQNKTVHFTVGHSQVSTVDAKTHLMTVVRDGRTIKTIPISSGSAEHPTYNGAMVISEMFKQTRMNGSTVGFTKTDGKGEYDIPDVPHAMRLSNSGTFIHGNYWGKGIFGKVNTSHGCIGLKDVKGGNDPSTDGAWFFAHSQLGDVVKVINSPDKAIQPDNGLNGWNMSWSQWVAGSAV
ncbi:MULTISPECIES: Ig-like domain-containing protein [unclassified Streptomyces]|uniref:L,D-transpeptidase n=1 Tax=unclassified Streptomyces TaxID=2593676 RepID=UPI00037F5326|nr:MULTISPECIES: Ig-like domain-containing protein [unclassified Streptomyces]MYT33394.1 L,D-transpeptidase family protein [Streptomyces sp. SID8354]